MPMLEIEWTDDCCGKKDYDGNIVSVSSRYWPRGGSHLVVSRINGGLLMSDGADPARQEICPSATSSIYLGKHEIARKDFEGETEEEVKRKVETWVGQWADLIESKILGLTQYEKGIANS